MLRSEQKNVLGGPNTLGNTIYEYDHFTGSQITIYFGDVLIDDANSITIRCDQTKVPVFGWASQYYSFLADGKILVSGDLTVAFKESGYLLYTIQRYSELAGSSRSPRTGELIKTGDLRKASSAASQERTRTRNVEQIANGQAGMTNAETARQLGAMNDADFENYAEAFEDVLWLGAEADNALGRDQMFSRNLPEGEEITNKQLFAHRRLDQYPPVDVWILYGDQNHAAANHTVRKLLDVSFTGQTQVIESNGQPIYERYFFLAKTFV
jgi:hypothetical protein